MASTTNTTAPAKSTPRDAQVMSAILKDMGVTDYEPRLINQMLEFSYRYVTDVLDDAKVYSNHAGKKEIDTEDVHLAVQCRMDQSFTTPPPRDLLMEIARHKNSQSLPLIKPYSGPRLPPDRYCLSAPNYKLVSNKKKTHRIQIGVPMNQIGPGHRIQLAPVHKQTSKIQLGTPSQMTVINRPSAVKPIIRVAPGQGLLSGVNTSFQQVSSRPQVLASPQIITANTNQTMITNPLKRKIEDDYDT